MKKVLHIATMDQGGAWNATYRLHKLISKNHVSKILVKNKSVFDNNVLLYRKSLIEKAMDYLHYQCRKIVGMEETNFDKNYYFHNFSEKLPNYNISKFIFKSNFHPDVIILHWVSGFVNAKTIYSLEKKFNCKVLWYCLDMSPLTGGCHYAWDCSNYQNNCGKCPALKSHKQKDISYFNLKNKYKYLKNSKIDIISSTPWVTRQLMQSSLFKGKKINEILLAVDSDIFSPLDKHIAKAILKIPSHKKVILTGSSSVNDKRKGVKYFIDAIKQFYNSLPKNQQENYFVLISGDYHEIYNQLPFENKCTGYLKDEISLALTYQAADVYVCTSIEDTGPMMINESIQCGVPVVSFQMGVAIKLVVNNQTGYCARLSDANDLAIGINKIMSMNDNDKKSMSDNCRKMGLELLNPQIQLQKFEEIFS